MIAPITFCSSTSRSFCKEGLAVADGERVVVVAVGEAGGELGTSAATRVHFKMRILAEPLDFDQPFFPDAGLLQ